MELKAIIKKFKESDSFWAGLLRDFLFVFTVVVVFALFPRSHWGSIHPWWPWKAAA